MKLFQTKEGKPLFFLDVACAVIYEEGKILITRRRKHDYLGGLWEFPGGKRLSSESLGACLKREVFEELGIWIEPVRFLKRYDHRYPDRGVSLYFYECRLVEGRPFPKDCDALCWVRPFELKRYSFPPADQQVIRLLSGH